MEELVNRSLVGLPCAHLDLRFVGIGHVHHQEEITHISVSG